MKNKQVKQMICDSLYEPSRGHDKNFKYVWLDRPCLVCFFTANFIFTDFGVVSLAGNQLRGK